MDNFQKRFLILISLLILNLKITAEIDPLSKITITSEKATCKKDSENPSLFNFTYNKNVLVSFADESKINSDQLEIIIDPKKEHPKGLDKNQTYSNSNEISYIKKITFKNNVHIERENRTIDTDFAELYLKEKTCNLQGNIKIKQLKQKTKDLPMTTNCQKATLNLLTEELTFSGDVKNPVNTTILIEGHPGLLKKVKTKEEKKIERRKLRELKRLNNKKNS